MSALIYIIQDKLSRLQKSIRSNFKRQKKLQNQVILNNLKKTVN